MIDHRMPPDSLYHTSPRDPRDYSYMGNKGVKWFAVLDVSELPFPSDTNNIPHPHYQGGLTDSCRNYSDAYVKHMVHTLRPIVSQLERENLISRAYVYGFDEIPQSKSCEHQIRKLFGATKKAFPRLKTAAALNWAHMPVDMPLDIWILQYELFDAANAMKWIAADKLQWHYHCIRPVNVQFLNTFIERPTFQARLLFWLAALRQLQYGAPSGWLYYAV